MEHAVTWVVCGMVCHGSQDTHIAYRPYFFNPFNLLDLGMIGVFIALIAVHIRVQVEAQRVDWENLSTFVNTYVSWCVGLATLGAASLTHWGWCSYELAALVRTKIYLLAITVFIVWIKTLEHLRVNSSLSTFILIIKGMLGKLSSFFIILAFSLVAFAGLEYVAFGLHFDDGSTLMLSLIRGFNGALVRPCVMLVLCCHTEGANKLTVVCVCGARVC